MQLNYIQMKMSNLGKMQNVSNKLGSMQTPALKVQGQMMMNAGEVSSRALTAAVTGAIGSYFLFGESGSVPILGMNLSAPLVVGGAMGVASLTDDFLSDWVYKKLPNASSPGAVNIEKLGTGLVLSGGAAIGTLKILTGLPTSQYVKVGLFGFGNKIASDYIHEKVIYKKTGGFLL